MIAAFVLSAALWTPGDVAAVRTSIDAALNAATLRGAHVGVLAVDAASGTLVYARNASDAFAPASTFKLLAGSAALQRLGPAFTFITEVDAGSNSLVFKGGGDPLLGAKDVDAAAAAVAATGASRVDALIGDATRYRASRYPGGWSIDDIPYGYAAIPSALSLEENVVHAGVQPGEAAGDSTTLFAVPATDAVTIENDVVTGARDSEDTTDVHRPWDRPNVIQLVGSYPLGAKVSDDFEPAVPDPSAYALDVLRLDLLAHGVSAGSVRQARFPAAATTTLWRHASIPLSQMLGNFWQPSDNFIGEQLLLELGVSLPAPLDTRAHAIDVEKAYLRTLGVDPASVTIADGSGLSQYDRITPAALVAILTSDWNGPHRQVVLDALPLAGVRGTLKTSFAGTPLAGNVYAKTGTMNHTRTLAGYFETKRHATVAFAILINDWMDESPQAAAAVERTRAAILEALQ